MVKQFDTWLVENVAERFTHWFQRITGKNNFWLARLCAWQVICFPVGLFCIKVILQGSIHELLSDTERLSGLLLFGMVTIFYIVVIRVVEKAAGKAHKRDCMNPLKSVPQGAFYRFFNLLWWCATLSGVWVVIGFNSHSGMEVAKIIVISLVWLFPITVIMHLMSCDPLPPSSEKSKITEWIASIRAYVTPAPKPVSAPST